MLGGISSSIRMKLPILAPSPMCIAKDSNLNQNTIHSFDMHNEEFRTICLPGIIESTDYNSTAYGKTLSVWN